MRLFVGLLALLCVVLAFAIVMPAAANENNGHDVVTSINVEPDPLQGPVVKAKWEEVDRGWFDDDNCLPGIQFDASCIEGKAKKLTTYAIVTDPDGVDDICSVNMVVEHDGQDIIPQERLCEKWLGVLTWLKIYAYDWYFDEHPGCLDYITLNEDEGINECDVLCELMGTCCDSGCVCSYTDAQIETLAKTLYEVEYESEEQIEGLVTSTLGGAGATVSGFWPEPCAWLYKTDWELGPCDEAGYYDVGIMAEDQCKNTDELWNTFEYRETVCCEFDFDEVNYGTVKVGETKAIFGDEFFSPPSLKPTVKNLGNVYATLHLWQSNMGFCDSCISFDARFKNNARIIFSPNLVVPECDPPELGDPAELNGLLGICDQTNMDFSVKVTECDDLGQHFGDMIVECVLLNGDG
jgi:hypothetical protein